MYSYVFLCHLTHLTHQESSGSLRHGAWHVLPGLCSISGRLAYPLHLPRERSMWDMQWKIVEILAATESIRKAYEKHGSESNGIERSRTFRWPYRKGMGKAALHLAFRKTIPSTLRCHSSSFSTSRVPFSLSLTDWSLGF